MNKYGGILRVSREAMNAVLGTDCHIHGIREDFSCDAFDVYLSAKERYVESDEPTYPAKFSLMDIQLPMVPEACRFQDLVDAPITTVNPWAGESVYIKNDQGEFEEFGYMDGGGRVWRGCGAP